MNPILLLHLLALQFLFAAAGPPQKKEIFRILQLTDFHVDEGYNSNGGVVSAFCHLDNNSPKKSKEEGVEVPSGKFGDHRCDAPQLLLEYVLSEARREVPKPDLIIWTGDNTPHVEFNSTDYAVHSTKWSSEAIRRYFGSEAPVIHDFNPANYVPDQPNELYEKTFELWKPWIGEEQMDSFLRGGYYKYSWKGQTFLVLNSNLYYVYNHQKMLDLEDPAGQFEFLRKELELGRKNRVKMNIVGHIPPGAFERELLKLMPAKYNQKLLDLMVEYAPWTNLFIFGHLHTDTFRIVKDAHGNPVQVIFVSAAVSPLHTNNPAFRIYELEVDTLEVHDIKNYFADLEKLNRNGPSLEPMRLEYSYRDAYQMSTLRPEAFAQLLRRLKRDTKTFLKYIHRNSVQSNFTAPSQRERSYQLCAIEFLDHDGYSKCIKTFPTADNGIKKKEGLPENFIVIFAVLSFVFSLNFHVL